MKIYNTLLLVCMVCLAPIAGFAEPTPAKSLAMMSTTLPCSDIERSIAFYTKGLGLTVARRMEMGSVIEVHLAFPDGGTSLILMHPKASNAALPERGSLARVILAVPDLKALQGQLESAGYPLDGPIREIAQYKVAIANVADPDGNHFELVQRKQ